MLLIMLCSTAVHLLSPSLPHTFGNRENLAFPACTAPFNEFPIYPNGALFDGTANPGLDRIVYEYVIPGPLP